MDISLPQSASAVIMLKMSTVVPIKGTRPRTAAVVPQLPIIHFTGVKTGSSSNLLLNMYCPGRQAADTRKGERRHALRSKEREGENVKWRPYRPTKAVSACGLDTRKGQ